MKSLRLALLLTAATLPAAAPAAPAVDAPAPAAAANKPELGSWGVELANRDPSVKPGDDFWSYANGTWAKTVVIPADLTSVGGFRDLALRSEDRLHGMLNELASKPQAPGSREAQLADFWASWMDEAGVEARGTAPLKPYLAQIAAVKDRGGLVDLYATPGFPSPLGLGITVDPNNPKRYVAGIDQGGLGLPNRDYYLRTDGKFPAFRAAYRDYIAINLRLAGYSEAEARADRIVALETEIAKAHWTPEQLRDPVKTYNPKKPAELAQLAPQFEFSRWLAKQGLANADTIVVSTPSAVTAEAALFASVPLETWKDHLAFHFIRSHAKYLPRAFDQAYFDFYDKTLRDTQAQRARWKRGVGVLDTALGESLGQLYVARYYPPVAATKMAELITDLRASLADRINGNSWMDAATRTQAMAKLDAFVPQIGHPVKYIDYAPLQVRRGDLLGNAIRAEDFQYRLDLQRFPQPVDRELWFMTPQTVNAYYNPLSNQITFPAAILQPPFFDPNADPAVNYGGIGAVIGHEIGHGFDDQGRQFAADGSLKDWWTPASAAKFKARADRLAAQYGAIEFIPGVKVNGNLTLGENIGDLSGVETAYGAWRRYVAKHGEPPVKDGLTGDQRFFLGYAQVWKGLRREGAVRQQLLTDPHSPERLRVNEIVRNVDAWYKAWNVKPGDKLYLPPAQRVHIW